MSYAVRITNSTVVDGTGAPRYRADGAVGPVARSLGGVYVVRRERTQKPLVVMPARLRCGRV